MNAARKFRYTTDMVEVWARGLSRRMSMERAARMCGVSAGAVARWRDGEVLTERMLCAAAVGMTAEAIDVVGTFGRIDSMCGRFSARVVGSGVAVELHEAIEVTR